MTERTQTPDGKQRVAVEIDGEIVLLPQPDEPVLTVTDETLEDVDEELEKP